MKYIERFTHVQQQFYYSVWDELRAKNNPIKTFIKIMMFRCFKKTLNMGENWK